MAGSEEKVKWCENNNKLTKLLISAIEEHQCLYQDSCKEYSDRDKRSFAQDMVLSVLKTVCPHMTVKIFMKKWSTLLTAFRREKKMVEASKKSGSDADNIYHPTQFWWNLMQFVSPEPDDDSVDNLDYLFDQSETVPVDDIEAPTVPVKHQSQAKIQQLQPVSSTPNIPAPRTNKRKREGGDAEDALIIQATKMLSRHEERQGPFTAFSKFVDAELNRFAKVDRDLAEGCKRQMMSILMEAGEMFSSMKYEILNSSQELD